MTKRVSGSKTDTVAQLNFVIIYITCTNKNRKEKITYVKLRIRLKPDL